MIAHGSRMSWTGILRPGDEFARARKSKLAVLKTKSGPPLRRYFGKWASAYRRFTTNLTSPKIVVKTLELGEHPSDGITCVLHWVDRRDMLRSDKGGVCFGDGWPVKLWEAFISQLDRLPNGTVGEMLRSFSESTLLDSNEPVSEWRSRLREGRMLLEEEKSVLGESWLPAPAMLVSEIGTSECIVS